MKPMAGSGRNAGVAIPAHYIRGAAFCILGGCAIIGPALIRSAFLALCFVILMVLLAPFFLLGMLVEWRLGSGEEAALDAGAIGVSTSRTFFHRSSDGRSTPSFEAAEAELMALAGALRETRAGAMQMITDFDDPERTFALLRRLADYTGRPLSFSLLDSEADWPATTETSNPFAWSVARA